MRIWVLHSKMWLSDWVACNLLQSYILETNETKNSGLFGHVFNSFFLLLFASLFFLSQSRQQDESFTSFSVATTRAHNEHVKTKTALNLLDKKMDGKIATNRIEAFSLK